MLPGLAGKPVAIIGGGPAHSAVDSVALRGKRFIATNSSGAHFLSVATADDILYFTDNSWSERWPHRIAEWPGIVATANRHAAARLGCVKIDVIAMTERMQVMPDIAQASSGHIAACLAALSGAARICLVGFDGRAVDGSTHGHRDYPTGDAGIFDARFLPGWRGLVDAFARLGVDVVNCTPDSAVACFRSGELAEEMRQ